MLPAFRRQIEWCEQLNAPFTAQVLRACAADLERGGTLARTLAGWRGQPAGDALALRVTGALHALVLSGADAGLMALYPSEGPLAVPPLAQLSVAIDAALRAHPDVLAAYLRSAPQTNEIGRAAALWGAFSLLADEIPLPLDLLELGASAGLNLRWDDYRYTLGSAHRGRAQDPARATPPVHIVSSWEGAVPATPPQPVVARAGCDLAPIDLTNAAERLRLRSYIWPEQRDRLARLDAAIDAAVAAGDVKVDAADAVAWLPPRLAAVRRGRLTVVMHTIFWQYLPEESQAALRATIETAGSHATAEAPLAWLALEWDAAFSASMLRLTVWPQRTTRVLANAHPHGRWVKWNPQPAHG